MPTPALSAIPKTYAELRAGVEAVLLTGQREIEQAKVRTYWETGRIIGEHLRLFEHRPGHGTATMLKLARDLKISDTVLYRCVRFVENFPILAARPKLTWGHYRLLIPVEDVAQRRALEREAVKHAWTTDQLDARIRPLRLAETGSGGEEKSASAPTARPLVARRGTPGLHLVVDRKGSPATPGANRELAVDLGFKLYRALGVGAARGQRFAAGEIVRLAGDGSLRRAEGATMADLYTYAATLRRVIDGDTLQVELEIAPGIFAELRLRLRGLDCPELSTPAGGAAKRFVEALVGPAAAIVINTTKPDKYDRYLADVFLQLAANSGAEPKEIYLNNALLENGHAVRKDAWEFGDWGG